MKYATAVVMGFLASGLVYAYSTPLPSPAPVLIALAFWAVSTYLLQLGAQTVAQVLGRGFLLGAAEWMAIPVGAAIYVLLVAPDRISIMFVITSAIAGFIALLCLAGFAVVKVWQRSKSASVTNSG